MDEQARTSQQSRRTMGFTSIPGLRTP
jgi:hypothetical protein